MIESRLFKKFQNRIAKCDEDIKNGVKVELRTEQKENYEKKIKQLKNYERVVKMYEKKNNKYFGGSVADILSFSDLIDVCNESQFGEKPLDFVADGIYVPVLKSRRLYDLREYIYLPASLIKDVEEKNSLQNNGDNMKTIEFEIIYAKNDNVHQDGFVEVPEDVEKFPEWFYVGNDGMPQPREFTHHDEIGIDQIGATEEQLAEIEHFKMQIHVEFPDYVNEVILTADEDEHRTCVKGDLIININGGAKLEWEIKQDPQYEEYVVELIPSFNGKDISSALIEQLEHDDETFDPYYIDGDEVYFVENGHIFFEMSKDFWEDEAGKTYNTNLITETIKGIFQKWLVREIGVYGIAHRVIEEQLIEEDDFRKFDDSYKSEWAHIVEEEYEQLSVDELYYLSLLPVGYVENLIRKDYEEEKEELRLEK